MLGNSKRMRPKVALVMWLLVVAVLGFDFYERYVQTKSSMTPPAMREALTIASYVFLAVVVLSFILKSRLSRPLIVSYIAFEFCRRFYMFYSGYISAWMTFCDDLFVLGIGSVWFLCAPRKRKDDRHD
jgi:hypothetical protein